METTEKTLEQKITDAMHRIEELYNETDGKCYVSFSGGKDSTVILALIKMCAEIYTLPVEGIRAVFSDTGIELGATRDFVRWCKENWYPNIEIIRPEKPFAWIIENRGKPIKSKVKAKNLSIWQNNMNEEMSAFNYLMGFSKIGKSFQKTKLANKDMHMMHIDFDIKASDNCCIYLKKKPFEKYNKEHDVKGYIIGERVAEGGARELNAVQRMNEGGKLCTKTKGKYIIKLPIVDWTNDDIEAFIEKYDVPLSKAYTEYGYERTGCFLCPFSLQIAENLEKLKQYEPNRYKASMHWLKDVYIAQGVELPFDEEYEAERKKNWSDVYIAMRNEMLRKYRPDSKAIIDEEQMTIDDFLGE